MADCSATEIIIGGTIKTRAALDALVNAVTTDWVGTEYGHHFEDDDEILDYIVHEVAAEGQSVVFQRGEAPWGKFPAIEAACQEHDLSYIRGDDGHYAYGASHEVWHPHMVNAEGKAMPFECGGSLDTGPAILIDTLLRWLGDGTGVAFADKIRETAKLFDIPPLVIDQAALDELANNATSQEPI